MLSDILAIVEFGAQKQRIPLNIQSSFDQICEQIYALFQLDPTKSKYLLQQQDLVSPGSFSNVEEQTFISNIKQYAINRKNNVPIRLRLVPLNMKIQLKANHENINGTKTSSKTVTQSQQQNDEIDRASVKSMTNNIDIKELIKKCLRNLRETTENIQLLDRCLHPEDYIHDESVSTQVSTPNIDQSAISVNMPNNDQVSDVSDSRQSAASLVEEIIPALNHVLETPQRPTISSSFLGMKQVSDSSSSSLSVPPTTNLPQPTTFTPKAPSTISSRTSNKSFSNRLGMIQSNPSTTTTPIPSDMKTLTSNSVVELKIKPALVTIKPPTISPSPSESILLERRIKDTTTTTPVKPKCQVELKQFESGSVVEGIVSVASNASYFFLQLIDDKKDEFDRFSKQLHDYYSNLDKNAHFRPTPGDFCVAMYTEDARWYRARLIRYISDQICEVFYIDYGNLEELPINLVHELLPAFARLPARAIACTIAEILPPIGQEGWTKRATFAFASRCSSERVQAIVMDSTNIRWPMHIVQLRVLKTDEDIGTSLENCKVVRRVSNQEICEFWSKKIRVEQYVLYNLPEPNLNRFPFIEQGSVTNGKQEENNTLLSASLQESPMIENVVTPEIVDQTVSTVTPDEVKDQPEVEVNEDEEEKPTTPQTPSSQLNPDAIPFFIPSTINNPVLVQSVSTGNESDDEKEIDQSPIVLTDSSDRPQMPIKNEVIVNTKLMPSIPLLRSWLPVEISHVETPTRFYIHYIYGTNWNLGDGPTPELVEQIELLETNIILNELTREMTECYSKHRRICPGENYDEGELVAVKFRSQWHRGRFLQYKPNIDFAQIFFVDHGFTRFVPIQMIRPINNRFVLHAEQAHLVHLHQSGGHRRGRIEWNQQTIDQFREIVREKSQLYARTTIDTKTIELMSFDPLTKKWFSFDDHFVKHLNTSDNQEQTN